MAEPPATPRFEDALAELEGLVQRLEKGELPLEESLAAFERGIALVRSLGQRLAEVEQRVEVLLKSEAGKLVLRPFENDEEQGAWTSNATWRRARAWSSARSRRASRPPGPV